MTPWWGWRSAISQVVCGWFGVGIWEDSFRWEMAWGKKLFTCLLVLVLIDLNLPPEGWVTNRKWAACDGSPTVFLALCLDLTSSWVPKSQIQIWIFLSLGVSLSQDLRHLLQRTVPAVVRHTLQTLANLKGMRQRRKHLADNRIQKHPPKTNISEHFAKLFCGVWAKTSGKNF